MLTETLDRAIAPVGDDLGVDLGDRQRERRSGLEAGDEALGGRIAAVERDVRRRTSVKPALSTSADSSSRPERKRRPRDAGELRLDLIAGADQRRRARLAIERPASRRSRRGRRRSRRARSPSSCRASVGDELKSLLTGDDVELAVAERQLLRVALDELDVFASVFAGDLEHPRGEVEPDGAPEVRHAGSRRAQHDSRAAGDVQQRGRRVADAMRSTRSSAKTLKNAVTFISSYRAGKLPAVPQSIVIVALRSDPLAVATVVDRRPRRDSNRVRRAPSSALCDWTGSDRGTSCASACAGASSMRSCAARRPGGLQVEPLERGISYRHVKARDVLEHWAKRGRPRAEAEREVNPDQRSLDDLLDR